MYSFGDRLRELRKSKGVSQGSLSALVDYSRENISSIENGRLPASKELIIRIAEALNVPYEPIYAWKILDGLTEKERNALFYELKNIQSSYAKPEL